MNRHCLYLTIAACWLLNLTTVAAQSFLKFYDPFQNWWDLNPQTVFLYPNGDFGVAMRQGNAAVAFLRTDANGAQLSFTGEVMPENRPHFRELDGSVVTASSLADSLVVWKRNPAQDTVWRTDVQLAQGILGLQVWRVEESNAGEIFVTGYYYTSGSNHFYYYTTKFAPDGSFLWKNAVTTNDYSFTYGVAPDGLGGCLSGWPIYDTVNLVNYSLLTRYLPDGSVAWHSKTYPNLGLNDVGYGTNDAGQSLIVQSEYSQGNDSTWLLLLGPTGDTVWHRYMGGVPEMCQLKASLVLPVGNDGFYVLGINYLDNLNQLNATVAKVNADGSVAWTHSFPNLPLGEIRFTAGRVLSDGSLVAAGRRGDNKIALLKLTPDGDLDSYQNAVEGRVVHDDNENCAIDSGEISLQNWIVTAKGPDYTLYGTTDATGHYRIPFIDTGTYQIFLFAPNYLWQSCPDTATITFPVSGQPLTDTIDFAVQAPIDCPLLEVDVSAPSFRRCWQQTVSAKVCNWGITPAIPAQLRIAFDPLISLTTASYPYTLEGDTIVFTFDTLEPLECRVVAMAVLVSCDAVLGQTLCITAHALPDSICLSSSDDWSGASIEVGGVCDGDSVRLRVTNNGFAPTSQPVDFVIIDDHVITRQGSAQLSPGQTKEETVPANGHTWRIVAGQEPGHPFGDQDPTVAVEGCTVTGNFTTGMLNLFANYSGNGFEDILCLEVINSYDPNDKTGYPLGVDAPHCIEAGQEMEYLIRFQNTGTDTAFRVEIRDTLPPWLNPASIRMGSASHPYTWSLSGTGALSVLFDGIMLPDSNVNEPASHGFVSFRIAQQTGNPVGAVLFNQAAIYFDDNAPVLTNTTHHTICEDFLEINLVNASDLPVISQKMQVFPNPAASSVYISLQDAAVKNREVILRDAFGRVVRRTDFSAPTLELRREGLVSGVYFVEMLENGVRVAVEKVVWQ